MGLSLMGLTFHKAYMGLRWFYTPIYGRGAMGLLLDWGGGFKSQGVELTRDYTPVLNYINTDNRLQLEGETNWTWTMRF